jgi:hypothetical protein
MSKLLKLWKTRHLPFLAAEAHVPAPEEIETPTVQNTDSPLVTLIVQNTGFLPAM